MAGAQAFASDPAILVCEAALKSTLKAPKTYERVSADLTGRSVYLTYDAVNSFNAPLRGRHKCDFGFMFNDTEYHIVNDDDVERLLAMEEAAKSAHLYPIPASKTKLK